MKQSLANISSFLFILLLLCGLIWIHPGAVPPAPAADAPAEPAQTAAAETAAPETPAPTASTTDPSDAPEENPNSPEPEPTFEPEPTPEPKPHYSLPEGAVLAPQANPAGFFTVPVSEAQKVETIIQQAREDGLLREDEAVVFNAGMPFNTGSHYQDIKCYYDETILAVIWKQIEDGNTLTCMEVKVADASQFRRKLTGDGYDNPSDYLSNLDRSTNAVVSMNADFYNFRVYGVLVYDGKLMKAEDKRYLVHNGIDYRYYNCLDNCYITRSGDMLFTYFGEAFTWEELQQYIDDNDIAFSLSFGPVLVDNYETQYHYDGWYPVAEVNNGYSRAGLGQLDERHYLYMSLNHSNEKEARWTMMDFAEFFQSRGVRCAYAFDGGQTSEIIFNHEIYNYIDRNSERWVSDMIWFGTALPEEVWKNG